MTETDRQKLIDLCVDACLADYARRKPEIVPAQRMKHKQTGQTHSLFGMPLNFKATDYEYVTIGYVYHDPRNGTTYGKVFESAASASFAYNVYSATTAAEFRAKLETMTDGRLREQADYWGKQGAA